MKNIQEVTTDLCNYYGTVEFTQRDNGKYYMELENYSGINDVEISKEFFEMAKKEFANE